MTEKLWENSENILNWMMRWKVVLWVEIKQWLMGIYNINNLLLIGMPYMRKKTNTESSEIRS